MLEGTSLISSSNYMTPPMLPRENSAMDKMLLVSSLIFVILPSHLLGHILDTMCVTTSPTGEPVANVSYLGIVSGFDKDAALFYRRAVSSRNYQSYSRSLGNNNCNLTSSDEHKMSCGFFRDVQISSVSHIDDDDALLAADRVTLSDDESNSEEKKSLRFGVFQCKASKLNFTETIAVIIMSPNAAFKPKSFTMTVNLEERVRLTMTSSATAANIRWRHISGNGFRIITDWNGRKRPVIRKVSLNDAGIYETYTMSAEEQDSGYIRLIVRGCRYNIWGHPASCEHTCPVCYNGGICDDTSGICICPPGFTGDRCENACSRGFVGQRCDVKCSLVSENEDCRGIEICLPDPFGCSCAPGYKGLDCSTECTTGYYGSGCTQLCHCDNNTSCDVKSGHCVTGECEDTWGGPMCQVKVLNIYGHAFPAVVNTGNRGTNSVYEAITLKNENEGTELKLGREVKTGNANTGSGVSNLNSNEDYVRQDTGLPYLTFPTNQSASRQLTFSFRSDRENEASLGVFYVEGVHSQRREHIPMLRFSNEAYNAPKQFTWTVGTGESVTLELARIRRASSLKWRHNGGEFIERANGQRLLRISNARKTDEGVYECYDEIANEKHKAIMLLKVRSCPSGKWGVYCNNTCPVCYYKGICHDETGECVCQAGYYGKNCSQVCSVYGTYGPSCDLRCGSNHNCMYTQICSPDPIGCHCRAGYATERCNRSCSGSKFGPDCSFEYHCKRRTIIDRVSGCSSNACHQDYGGPGCQDCTDGFYGKLCNYPCHCLNPNGRCDRMTGSCGGDRCAEGWGGENCTDTLPALVNPPVFHIIEDEVLILWDLWRSGVDYGTGPVKFYVVKYERNGGVAPSPPLNVTGYSVLLEDLEPLKEYSVTVAAVKDIGGEDVVGPDSPSVNVTSSCGKPNFHPKINNVSSSDNVGLLVRWRIEAPQNWLGCSPSIRLYYRLTNNQHFDDYETKDYIVTEMTESEIQLQHLRQCTSYDVKLAVVYMNGKTSSYSRSVTAITDSSGILPEIEIEAKHVLETTVTITWELRNQADTDLLQNSEESLFKFNITVRTPGGIPTIAACNLTEQSHTIMDLMANTTYTINVTVEDCAGHKGVGGSVVITTRSLPTKPTTIKTSTESSNQEPSETSSFSATIPISLSLLVLLVVILVFILLVIKRNKQRFTSKRKVEDAAESVNMSIEMHEKTSAETDIYYNNLPTADTSIALNELHNYVQSKKLVIDGFQQEFMELMSGKQRPCTVGESEVNIKKNRFKNVVTYDHSRVKLPIINNDPSSDYFNASYINGYDKPNAFIASQGPNKASLNDFWRMIWHVQCEKIIMVTNTVEAGKTKCLQYWRDDDMPRSFANVIVRTTKQNRVGEVVTRHLRLHKNGEDRDVIQYHFTGWPDMKVPQSADVLWDILDEAEKIETANSPPIVVHCSAGCGRTGTLIALSAMRKMLRKEGKVDIFKFVNAMREQRPTMVQRPEQYQFIYESLLTYGLVGKTSIRATDFSSILRNLKSLDGKVSNLEKQFNVLKYLNPFADHVTEQCGAMSVNANKNRFPEIIPLESFRPKLMTNTEDPEDTDYINASFCDGYTEKDVFLATQIPLPNTVVDFWRLLYDYKCFVVVLFQHRSYENGANYYPLEGRCQYGPFAVEKVEQHELRGILRRTFRLAKTDNYYVGEHAPYLISHFSVDESDMENKTLLLDLIERVYGEHRQKKGCRIGLLCWNGVDHNSVFMAVYNSCERLRDDGIVDMFSLVRELRERRPEMIGTLEQYEFCMDTIQLQIDSTSLYANT